MSEIKIDGVHMHNQIALLRNFLKKEVTSDYVYLDLPDYRNIGDWLIAMGAWQLLKELPYRCLLCASIAGFNYEWDSIPSNTVILLNGGGNFGDLYPGAVWFRNEVVKHCPNNKIIFLPQTITYQNISNLDETITICGLHSNLVICARDKASYEILQRFSNKSVLLPDTAWGLYDYLANKRKAIYSDKVLAMQRRDEERTSEEIILDVEAEVKDWLDFLDDMHYPLVNFPFRVMRYFAKRGCRIMWKWSDRYLKEVVYPYVLKGVVGEFSKYKKVYSTRLHGFILASMLHIDCEWIDTKYGKISSYVKTWMNE